MLDLHIQSYLNEYFDCKIFFSDSSSNIIKVHAFQYDLIRILHHDSEIGVASSEDTARMDKFKHMHDRFDDINCDTA